MHLSNNSTRRDGSAVSGLRGGKPATTARNSDESLKIAGNYGFGFLTRQMMMPKTIMAIKPKIITTTPSGLRVDSTKVDYAVALACQVSANQWRAIHQASRILDKIDERWPRGGKGRSGLKLSAVRSGGQFPITTNRDLTDFRSMYEHHFVPMMGSKIKTCCSSR